MGRQEFEICRVHVSHDMLKNQFLERLGTTRGSVDDNPEKTALMLKYLSSANDDCIGAEATSNSIDAALTNWPAVKASVTELFDRSPNSCGLVPTELFEAMRDRCIGEQGSLVSSIDDFVLRFRSLGSENLSSQMVAIREFWKVADELYGCLIELKPNGGVHAFVDYLRFPVQTPGES